MELVLQTEAPPMYRDSSGGIRIGNSRVLLELVIRAFEDGATPEAITQRYSTVTLAEVYSVIAYYLRHRKEIESYMVEREQQAGEVRKRIESHQRDITDLRNRLESRKNMAES
ncbi:DUF433 domain-containing protein [Chloroflexi bacterium TSY]|nr:DUF433 domain-containing protein [Chloroflexi bacterium TSY]